MKQESKFYFDLYVDKRFIHRFNSYVNAEHLLLRYKDSGHIEKVKKRKLSTEKNNVKNQSLIKKSTPKNEKLCTGMQTSSLFGAIFAPHIKKKKNKINNLKKEKRKKGFPVLKAGKGPALETTQTLPTFFCGGSKIRNEHKASADLKFVENACQKIESLPKIVPQLQNKHSTLLWKG